jgi:hypothetical protein
MARDPEALLARVQKLLALATSPNIHEAAAAAARAQALIEAHHLEDLLAAAERDVAEARSIDDGRAAPLEVGKRLRRWKVVLATVLAEYNACVAFTEDRGRETALCLAGRAADREVTAALYAWLVVRIEWLSATHGAGRDRRWHEAFRIGAAEVIAHRLAHPVSSDVVDGAPDATTSGAALVKADRAARQDAVDRFVAATMKLDKGRSFSVDAHGYKRGRAIGAAVDPRKT